ncbi:hypothetical protein [Pseudomonas fluorescens]|jgi:hypothetical protein|uniref:hypothetical protein n=1 Tax=Pseudomonas fluorescens TaxID=294 RepID=UPI00125B06E1|nr:hypothetical protein [Pseudomonas fluorescens]WKV96578.1 hypothetical protein PYV50_22860 [Pseudomonas sp. H22_DOA]VVO90130.1 hypothetical protein PS876_02255 [Pseudomonas fluorescens]VVP87580.1 hypothetical protein PS906_03762 [Pseudomonas fluorescens]
MNSRRVIGLAVHALACVIYIVLNGYAVPAYKQLVGGLTSRGVAIGMAMYLIFYFFVSLNLILVFIQRQAIQFGLVIFMMLTILFYLLPQYPIRGLAYCALTGGLAVGAVLLSNALNSLYTRWCRPAGGQPLTIHPRRATSRLLLITALIGVCICTGLLGLKIFGGATAEPITRHSNDSGECYLVTYAPGYHKLGLIGRVFELFAGEYFFRVYTADGALLESSEWNFRVTEIFGGPAEFSGSTVLYSGTQGYEDWWVPECA